MKVSFSVVIPVYNAEKWVEQCLASIENAIVRAGDAADVEVICVDDGSVDRSGVVLDRYAARHGWCKVVHQENAGPCFARNVGLRHASGEWVSFVDGDDWVRDDYFLQFTGLPRKADVNFFAHTRMASSGEFRINGFLSSCYVDDHDEIGRFVFRLIFNRTGENLFGYTWNKFIRREVLEKHQISFPELKNYIEYEDEIFTFKVCHHALSLSYLPQPLYYYRLGENNSSSRRVPRHLERSQAEIRIGDQDDREDFRSAAYMSAGMALLQRSYTSASPRAAVDAVRFLKGRGRGFMRAVGPQNRLLALSRKNVLFLFLRLWAHGVCVSAIRQLRRKG